MIKNVRIMGVSLITVVFLACLMTACPEVGEEPSSHYALVELLPGSPGYEGDGAVHGLLNGSYLVMHQKKQTQQDRDPEGRIRIWHEVEWFSVGKDGVISTIASSTSDIPARVENTRLEKGEEVVRGNWYDNEGLSTIYQDYHANRFTFFAVNSITGLDNGETYGVYRYGELSDGDNVGRYNGHLQSEDGNTFINLKGFKAGQSVGLFDAILPDDGTGLLNANNHLVVLTPTRLHWTKTPQVVFTNIRLSGYDYDIIIESRDSANGNAVVSAIEFDGQQYFILKAHGSKEAQIYGNKTGNNNFAGFIRIVNKQ